MNHTQIERLNMTLKISLEQHAKEITYWHKKLIETYELKKSRRGDCINNDITVMEIYVSVLYAIIAIATFFRADFKSDIVVEKRLNLKYLCFVSTEFFKAVFIVKQPHTLWRKLESILLIDNYTELVKLINDSSSEFRTNYFDSGRRDISLHYDFNLEYVYQHLCEVDEEPEANHIASLLTLLQPLCLACSSYLKVRYPEANIAEPLSESVLHQKFRTTLRNNIYDSISCSLQNFATHLDKNMESYRLVDNPQIRNMLSEDSYMHITSFRECIKLSVLLHYFYLDLGTAVRGYLVSENYYEQQLHAIRLNVIIYEGYKKIFLPQNNDDHTQSLWEQYVRIPVLASASVEGVAEMENIERMLQGYSENKDIKNIRHHYSHFKKNNKLYLIDLWSDIISLNPIIELKKALDFLKLLSRIIKFSKPSLEYFTKKENERAQNELLSPLEKIFAKAMLSCKSIEDRENLNKHKREFENMILEAFNRMTNPQKRIDSNE